MSGNSARNDWPTSTRRSRPRPRLKGVPYAFDAIAVTPNTLDAHRLIRWSHDAGKQHEMAERLFQLYWSEGGDIGKRDVLIKAAVDVGLDATLVSQLLDTEADLDAVITEIDEAAELGISGVPTSFSETGMRSSGRSPPRCSPRLFHAFASSKEPQPDRISLHLPFVNEGVASWGLEGDSHDPCALWVRA